MTRSDSASRLVRASPERVFEALVDRDALVRWLPPQGMTGHFEHFDPRAGGSYRLVLTYADGTAGAGKSSSDSDVVEASFVEVTAGERVVQAVEFESEDPAFAGTMLVTWQLSPTRRGTTVQVRAEGVPPGITAEAHVAGMESSLANLAAFVERATAR